MFFIDFIQPNKVLIVSCTKKSTLACLLLGCYVFPGFDYFITFFDGHNNKETKIPFLPILWLIILYFLDFLDFKYTFSGRSCNEKIHCIVLCLCFLERSGPKKIIFTFHMFVLILCAPGIELHTCVLLYSQWKKELSPSFCTLFSLPGLNQNLQGKLFPFLPRLSYVS